MFVDKVLIQAQAGDGGNGMVNFRHEKYVDRGGPDGGDGGNGGDVVLEASFSQNTLAAFRFQRRLEAESGEAGTKRKRHGRNGSDLVVPVPVGTVISDSEGRILADLIHEGQQTAVALGGKGGFGNAHFISSTRQAPQVAEKGEPGEEKELTLELKMIADVGLVGLPNAGKSTLLSVISNARPEIADYPFTTLKPNLGVVDMDKQNSLLFADIPGLIEGASQGKGLGDEFLRHVERTLVLVHLIDIYQDDIAGAYKTIQTELKSYKADLSKRPQVVVLSKIDGLDDEIVQARLKELKPILPKGTKLLAISAPEKRGLKELLYTVQQIAEKARQAHAKAAAKEPDASLPVLTIPTVDAWHVIKTDDGFRVSGRKIERFASRTDFDGRHGIQRLRDIMKKMGIAHELSRQGVRAGDQIAIGPQVFSW